MPVLRRDYVAGAIVEPESREIDVDGLHQGFLRGARKRGTEILTDCGVEAIGRRGGQWIVETAHGRFAAPVIVNAAGAWADQVAAMAAVAPIGLTPKRRTAFNIPAPGSAAAIADWPLVHDVGEEFYFKPDAGKLFVSPEDATPSEPMDAYPEDLDVAIGVDRLQRATTIEVQAVSHKWAGLRTFAPDGSPVVGFDPEAEGFFWLAGQGGYGIKTSPALSRLAPKLIRSGRLPDDIRRLGIEPSDLAPDRLRNANSPSNQTDRNDRMNIERLENGPRFCRVLRYNGTVYIAGMTADDLSGDTTAQTREILAKIDALLAKAGCDKTRLLSATIWLRDIADFDKMNAAWDAWIDRSAMPVRATVEARLAGDQYRVEIMVTAATA